MTHQFFDVSVCENNFHVYNYTSSYFLSASSAISLACAT